MSARRWWLAAACRGRPVEWWYPPPGGAARVGRLVCAGCPVRAECLASALEEEARTEGARYGFWGGTSPRERAQLARSSSPAPVEPAPVVVVAPSGRVGRLHRSWAHAVS